MHKHKPFFTSVKKILSVFKRKPEIINENHQLQTKAIFIANHQAIAGPMTLTLYLPSFFIPWGAYQMTENYVKRWHYLYHILYVQKLKKPKILAFFLATVFALFSKMIYNGLMLIPSYPDMRLLKTFKMSAQHINEDKLIFIFPEDSKDGYFEHSKKLHSGFVSF